LEQSSQQITDTLNFCALLKSTYHDHYTRLLHCSASKPLPSYRPLASDVFIVKRSGCGNIGCAVY